MDRTTRLKNIKKVQNQIKKDFDFIATNPKILGVILYGSILYAKDHQRSDIDICIVTKYPKLIEAYNYLMENLKTIRKYDIRFFKELPLVVQGEIMENGSVILSNGIYELYEYLFPYRKKFEDWKFKIKCCL